MRLNQRLALALPEQSAPCAAIFQVPEREPFAGDVLACAFCDIGQHRHGNLRVGVNFCRKGPVRGHAEILAEHFGGQAAVLVFAAEFFSAFIRFVIPAILFENGRIQLRTVVELFFPLNT